MADYYYGGTTTTGHRKIIRGGYKHSGSVGGPATVYASTALTASVTSTYRIAASPRFPLPAWSSHVVDDDACRLAVTALYNGRIF